MPIYQTVLHQVKAGRAVVAWRPRSKRASTHGRMQAQRIDGAQLHECPGEAHLLVADHLGEILRTVVDPRLSRHPR